MKLILAGLALLIGLTACDRQTAAPAPQIFVARGVVKELRPDGKTVVIQHEAISNYMEAMTMPFEVRDAKELNGLKPGDVITFHLVVTKTNGWVEDIVRTGKTETAASAPPGMTITKAVEPLDEGDLLPDYQFINELGAPVRLSQYKGQVIAFTFFFTSCPFPNFCPRLENNFAQTAALLAGKKGAPARWHLFSISFDPEVDTPAHLRSYAEMLHYDPAHWSFLTGAPEQIRELADQVGENFWRQSNSISHNLRTVVVDARGRLQKIYLGNTWTSAELAAEMARARATH